MRNAMGLGLCALILSGLDLLFSMMRELFNNILWTDIFI